MANHSFYSGGTPSGETSATHDISAPGTFSLDLDQSGGDTTPTVTLLYEQPSSGRMVPITNFRGPGAVALDAAARTIAVRVGDNPDSVPVYAEWQDS